MAHVDAYNRPISYLRISVTDRCNLRCNYCMPPEGVPWRPHEEILRYEEIEIIVRAAAGLGISKVRLTGGEPLIRAGIVDLVRNLAHIPGIDDLAMTTNGVLLSRYAADLAEAGLHRVNVSLDTLRPERFRRITRCGDLEDVLDGMKTAREAGLEPIKINTVVIRGMNDDEVVDLARKTMETEWNIRFIELMPIGNSLMPIGNSLMPIGNSLMPIGNSLMPMGNSLMPMGNSLMPVGNGAMVVGDWRERVVAAAEIREQIEAALGKLEPAKMSAGGGPARYYRLPGAQGTLGFITPISEHFCYRCNRLRLTADGQLRPCLLSDQEIDLRTPLRQGANVAQIKALLLKGIESKPLQHRLDECQLPENRVMSEIGG